jgi:hypothetical protein
MAQLSMVGENTVTDGTHVVTDDSVYGAWEFAGDEGGLAVLRTATLDPTDTDAALVSPGIPGIMAANRKLRIGFNTTLAGANVTSDFGVQGSYNGKDWTLISELDADVTPDVTGIQEYELDLTDKYYPWLRLIWNDGTENNTTWQGYFFVSGLKSGSNISALSVGGVGADPS